MATLVHSDDTVTQTHVGGSPAYMAPEMASLVGNKASNVSKKFSPSVDVYSLAVMFFEMAVGLMPDITADTMKPLENRDDAYTLELLQFMLKLNSRERPSAAECVRRVQDMRARSVDVHLSAKIAPSGAMSTRTEALPEEGADEAKVSGSVTLHLQALGATDDDEDVDEDDDGARARANRGDVPYL